MKKFKNAKLLIGIPVMVLLICVIITCLVCKQRNPSDSKSISSWNSYNELYGTTFKYPSVFSSIKSYSPEGDDNGRLVDLIGQQGNIYIRSFSTFDQMEKAAWNMEFDQSLTIPVSVNTFTSEGYVTQNLPVTKYVAANAKCVNDIYVFAEKGKSGLTVAFESCNNGIPKILNGAEFQKTMLSTFVFKE